MPPSPRHPSGSSEAPRVVWEALREQPGGADEELGQLRKAVFVPALRPERIAVAGPSGAGSRGQAWSSQPGGIWFKSSSSGGGAWAGFKAGRGGGGFRRLTGALVQGPVVPVQALGEGARVADGVLEDLRHPAPRPSLPEGDLRLLGYLQQGLSNQEIGSLMHLSLGGVKARMRGLFDRFGVNDRVKLVVEAMRRGVLPPEERG